ncbi:hypothetical protein GIB67_022274 [Kingdonia uniflora]|uniref:Alpha-1,3-mannosyl-glycoprotein 2-beta-N-acetylglucosaminyltransferase n=1 Tax=Kingdonia uniflora TaxID=39325 RepID=A0A7J7M738_9MAGN|nr:hypothetical protein GIB67_022274 [Kingdonia uniflora]
MGQFFKQYLEPIKLNDAHVDLKSMDLSYLMEGNYLRYFANIVSNAKPVYGTDVVLKAYNIDGDVRILLGFNMLDTSVVTVIMAMVMNLAMMKTGYEEPQEQLHRIRISLSSKSIKNLEKVCANHVSGAKSKLLKLKGLVRMCLLFSRLPLGNLPVEKYVSTQLSNYLHRANDYYFRCKWTLLKVQSWTTLLYTVIGP